LPEVVLAHLFDLIALHPLSIELTLPKQLVNVIWVTLEVATHQVLAN
jgi:hypothetical protein